MILCHTMKFHTLVLKCMNAVSMSVHMPTASKDLMSDDFPTRNLAIPGAEPIALATVPWHRREIHIDSLTVFGSHSVPSVVRRLVLELKSSAATMLDLSAMRSRFGVRAVKDFRVLERLIE